MNDITFILTVMLIALNWVLKLIVALLMYSLAIWLNVPEWAMIAMVAVGASETKIVYRISDKTYL